MRARNDVDHDLLELADESGQVAGSLDDLAMRTRLHEVAGELRELAVPIPA